MHHGDNDIYVSAPLRRLQDAQMRALMPELQRCFGTHALMLGAAKGARPPALPMLGSWVRLYLHDGCYLGDLRAAALEPLPFMDDVFDLVLLRHALEVSPAASGLLVQAIRVLAPGGVLALTGVHPLSGWMPWLRWQAGGRSLRLQLPLRLQRVLRQEGLGIELAQRVGRSWPWLPALDRKAANVFGGGYVLIARKHPRLALPRRIVPTTVAVPAGGRLSPGTRRSSALQTTRDA
ncbi:MAG: methyltransferase domain-containing protein [Rhodanobacter sp.]|nr:MAG: methyltransferase domain-containing protein [Rhodanobacter sp.]TAL99245.1 MAG: methyltransferase domain-containing protein [Rhodanobacter sp.]TAM41656.1 MAG: methyltransferase domain-containing protein [Rhodanobacter sp.]